MMEVTEKKSQDNNMKEATHIVREVPGQQDARDFDVYGDEEEADSASRELFLTSSQLTPFLVKYRTLVWWKAAALMLAETVSLGVRMVCMSVLDLSDRLVDSISTVSVCQPWHGGGNNIGHCA